MPSDVPEDLPRRLLLALIALLILGSLSVLTVHLFRALAAPAPTPASRPQH